MTAVGFFFLVFAWMMATLDDYVDVPELVLGLCSLLVLAGPPLMLAGVTTWLWRVMP